MQFKKLTYILVLILLGASGLLSGCKTVYDKMKLELSVEQIELYLPLEEDPILVEEPVGEGVEEEIAQSTTFTATVSNVPKNILKSVTYQTTNDGIVSVALGNEKEGQTEIEVTALRPGRTDLIIKTLEGNKSKTVAVLVLKRIEGMTLNENYKLAVAVGTAVSINTAQAIQFYPINTNQKDVIYSLSEEVPGVSITEAGLITVTEKMVDEITVTATSVADENLSVSFNVVIVDPIKQEDILITTQKKLDALEDWILENGSAEGFVLKVTNILMANNHVNANAGSILVDVNSSENYRVIATSSNNDIVEVVEIIDAPSGMHQVFLKANNLGQVTLTIRAEIVGYEQYYASQTATIVVANFANSVLVDDSITEREVTVYNNYAGVLGREIKLNVAPSTAYSKQIKLFVEEEDLGKITITYSDGTVIPTEQINETILPRGMSIYVSANIISSNPDPLVRNAENTVEILFIANSTIASEVEVVNKAILNLTQGATALSVPSNISLQQGLSYEEYPNISFVISPAEAANDVLTIEIENDSVVSVVSQGSNVYKIVAENEGVSNIWVTTSNGIQEMIEVEVYVPLVGAALQIESPAQNYNVAERILDATPNEYETLIRATMAVGAGIQMFTTKYPNNASILSVTYNSSNNSVASINNNGYIVAKAIGTTTITVTIVSKEYLTNQTSTTKTTIKTFSLSTYVPVKEINLNALQIELYEQNTLGYFDLDLASYQLSLAITPNNASLSADKVVWDGGNFISINQTLVNGLPLNGLVTASIPLNENIANNTVTTTVTVSVTQYGRYYAKTAVITIKRAVKVESVTIYDVPQGYIYFDAREGVANAGTKQLSVQTYPYTATNSNVRYVYVQDPEDESETPVFSVNAQGLITPIRAGIAKVHVVAEDSYINENAYIRYNEVVVKVADGLTEATALELYSATDVKNIDSEYELSLHYVLANNIDFLNQTFTPIGLIGGVVYPFTGSINGQFSYGSVQKNYQIKGLKFAGNSASTYYSGFIAENNGTIKNLKLEILNWNIETTNNTENSVGYFGGVVAINNGLIQNVTVFISNAITNNATLKIANQTSYVGLLAAQNNHQILNSISYGQFEVTENINLAVTPTIYVGGMVGMNTSDALLEGQFVPANKVVDEQGQETTYSNENVLYQKEGINAYPTIITRTLQNSATGGAVGFNEGTVNKLSTDGVIDGANNVGGVIGIHIGNIQNSFSASQVKGNQNVGGLVGYATSQVVGGNLLVARLVNNAVEIYDRKNTYEQATIAIEGVNYVGGFIGYADALQELEYNYVNSYVLRTLGENYLGDIVLTYEDETQDFVFGGLIGTMSNVSTPISKNYVIATMATVAPSTSANTPNIYAGGLIGRVEGDFNLSNSYTRGEIVLPMQNANSTAGKLVGFVESTTNSFVDFVYSTMNVQAQTTANLLGATEPSSVVTITNDDYLLWDIENSQVWYLNALFNDGYPVLYNAQDNLLINEAPQTVVVTVLAQEIIVNPADNSISFHHLKADDKKAVVQLRETPYSIRNLIQTVPNNARYYLTTTNTDIVQILDDGSILTLKEGTATIQVSSVLNKNIFDTFELAVIKGFNNFYLSKTQGISSEQVSLQDVIALKLEESVILYSAYTSQFGSVGGFVGATYTATTQDFTVNNLGLELGAVLNNISTHILTAGNEPSLGNILVTVTPHFKATFEGQTVILPIVELRKQFYVSIYAGANSVTTSMISATIGLTEEIELEVYVTTDKENDNLDLFYQALDQDISDNIGNYIEAISLGSESVEDEEDNYLYDVYRYLIKAKPNFLEVNLGSGNFKSAKSGNITFTPVSNLELSTTFHITITPQDLLRIDMAHYPTGETQIENGKAVYYPRELPSNIIAPAQPGILKINLYPEYANIDYYEIVSSVNAKGQFVSLEQVALINNLEEGVIDNVSYSAVTPAPTGIPYGTTLSLISSANIEGNTITNLFDGNIYVRTLISSQVQLDTKFTITITGYRYNEQGVPEENLSKTIELDVDALPGISLLYNGERTGYVERGTRVPLELYVSDDYTGTLREPVVSKVYADTDGENEILGAARTIYVDYDAAEDTFYLVTGHGVPSGSTIEVTAKVERTINGVLETRESTIELQVVNFLVDRVDVLNTIISGAKNTMNLYVGERTQLLVNLQSAAWNQIWSEEKLDELYGPLTHPILEPTEERIKLNNIKNEILAEIAYLEKMFSRNMKTWYERTGVNLQTKTGLEENSYINYMVYRSTDPNAEEGEYVYEAQKDVHIGAKKVSTNTVLGAEIQYYYDEAGRIQPAVLQNGVWVKYPQINQELFMQDAQLSTDNIQKLKAKDFYFNLNITPNSTEDKPVPVYNEQDFANMQPGIDYILLNDAPLVLENWVPINTAIRSLDGNGRTIELKSFASSSTQGSYNFGLFGTVNENTVLKNIKLDVGALAEAGGIISATEFNEVNFGFLAAINYGTITNVDVFNSSSSETPIVINTNASAIVVYGGLVAHNINGYITNSRVGRMEAGENWYEMVVKTKGTIAGFVGYNEGVITSSYVANLTLENTSLTLQNSKTGGFAAVNASRGRINQSFVEGIQASLGEAAQTTEKKVIQRGGVSSVGNVGGFVYENQGAITDSYSNIPVTTESRSAGFVYQNMESGVVTNAYSLSKIAERSLAHLPFVGNNSLEQLLNFGSLTNTYYIANVDYFTTQFGDDYPAVSVSDFSLPSGFNGFGFLNETGYQQYGAWIISSSYARPTIPSALEATSSERMLVDTTVVGGEIVEYFYTDVDYTDKRGTGNNPILVATAKQFLEAMTLPSYRDFESKINDKKIRLIKDIDFNEILNIDEASSEDGSEENRLKLANLQTTVFIGKLDGNGMTLKNVRILSSIYTDTGAGSIQQAFGMFNRIGLTDNNELGQNEYILKDREKAVVKNLNIEVTEISATEAVSVGVLAGEIYNSIILNVNVTGQNITVQGRNLVGGLAGRVIGDSRIINITSNLSISSEYRTTELELDGVTVDYSYYNEYGVDHSDVSYAGGIIGVIDLYTYDEFNQKQTSIDWALENPKVVGLTVKNNLTIRGEKTGGIVGYVGPFTYIKNALFEVNHIIATGYQSLIGSDLVGGITAENSGLIDHARVQHEENYQNNTIDITSPRIIIGYQSLIKENANYAGGLIGYNNNGAVLDSYSRLDISNQNIKVVGGLIGYNYGGSINRVFATGHLAANSVVGGFIGILANESLQNVDEMGVSTEKTPTIKNAFAINNWQLSAFQNVNKDTENVALNGAWKELDGTINEQKFIGAFIGKVLDASHIENITRSWYIDELFSVTGPLPISEEQTKYLREVGNVVLQDDEQLGYEELLDGLRVIAQEGKTQFETITDLTLISTQNKYSEFAASSNPEESIWTLNSVRVPQLRFNNVSDIWQVTTEVELRDAIRNYPYSTIIIMNDIYLTDNWVPMSFRGAMIGKEVEGIFPTIYYVNIDNNLQDTGFFSILDSASISNLNFVVGGGVWANNVNGIISTSQVENSSMGILAGNMNNSSIKNVQIRFANSNTAFESSTQFSGLLAGKAKNVIIENVSVNSLTNNFSVEFVVTEVTPNDYERIYVGGAFGQVQAGILKQMYVKDIDVKTNTNSLLYLGGFAGRLDALHRISETEVDVNLEIVTANSEEIYFIGGFVGEGMNLTLVEVTSTGNIIANVAKNLYLGGLAGYLENSSLEFVYYVNEDMTSITSISTNTIVKAGGLIGYAKNTRLENTHAIASVLIQDVNSTTYVGGLVGQIQNDDGYPILLAYAKTDLKVSSQGFVYIGGLIGSNQGSSYLARLEEVYSEGRLEVASPSTLQVGGLVGANVINTHYAFSATRIFVNSKASQEVGGLMGSNAASVSDTYVYGTVYSSQNIAADAQGLVVNPIIGDNASGAILTRVYFNKDIIGLTEREQYGSLAVSERPNKSHTELLNVSTALHQNKFVRSTGTYLYLANLPKPDITSGSLLNPVRVTNSYILASVDTSSQYFVQETDLSYAASYFGLIDNFDGIYNGNGYTITYTQSASSGDVGLFINVHENAVLARVGVIATLTLAYNATDPYNVAGLATYNHGIIYKSYAKTTIIQTGTTENDKLLRNITLGGLVANNYKSIENSFAVIEFNLRTHGNLQGVSSFIGGLVGQSASSGNSNPTINTSFATGRLLINNIFVIYQSGFPLFNVYASGFVGRLSGTTLSNSFSTTTFNTLGTGTITFGMMGINSNSDILNTYFDKFAANYTPGSSYAKTTKEMASSEFITTLLAGNKFKDLWIINKTIHYGYPYPYYIGGIYANNALNTGDGTYLYPYLIPHAGRLDWIRTQLASSAYFKQTSNINLSLFNMINTSFMPIGSEVAESTTKYGTSSVTAFIGIYDGQNYEISNLVQTFSSAAQARSGLFRTLLGGATYRYGYVYNTHLKQVNITISQNATIGESYIGGISSIAGSGSKIINSSVIGQISDLRDNADLANAILVMGGLTGYSNQAIIDSNYANVNMVGASAWSYLGGLIGWSVSSQVLNSYTASPFTLAPENTPTSTLYTFGGVIGYAEDTTLYNVRSGKNITIDTVPYYEGTDYIKQDMIPQNYGIGGIVGNMSGGTITHAYNYGNLQITAIHEDINAVGGIIGRAYDITKLETLSNNGTITMYYGTKYANVTSYTAVGGIAGYLTTSSYSTVNVQYVENKSNITLNPITTESSNADYSLLLYVGGLIGYSDQPNYTLQHSYNSGHISAKAPLQAAIGGLVGSYDGYILYSYNSGNVSFDSYRLLSNMSISKYGIYVYVGGIAGVVTGELREIHYTYNTGNVTAQRMNDNTLVSNKWLNILVGGIAAKVTRADIEKVYNSGIIFGKINYPNDGHELYVGGLVGYVDSTSDGVRSKIQNAYNIGSIEAYITIAGQYVADFGGLAHVGGIAGALEYTTLYRIYNSARLYLTGPGYYHWYGYFVGLKNSIIYNYSYYNALQTGIYAYPNQEVEDISETSKTLAQLQTQSTYVNWDFTNIWSISAGQLPRLRYLPENIAIIHGPTVEPTVDLDNLPQTSISVPQVTLGTPS